MSAIATVLGSVLGFIGQSKQAKAAKKAERARKRQMELDAMRKRRESIRQAQVARAEAESSAVSQGAGAGSGLAGGLAQITSQQNQNLQYSFQDQQLGERVFKANAQYASAGTLIGIGSGISSLGGAFG
jgi:hypothetical protein